jgi:hypothetical protein
MAKELFEVTRDWFRNAFAKHAAEMPDLRWELSFAHLPNPKATAGEPRMTSVMVLYVQYPTGNGAQHIVNTILLSPGFDERYVDNEVADACAGIARSLAEIGQGFALPEADLRKAGLAT